MPHLSLHRVPVGIHFGRATIHVNTFHQTTSPDAMSMLKARWPPKPSTVR